MGKQLGKQFSVFALTLLVGASVVTTATAEPKGVSDKPQCQAGVLQCVHHVTTEMTKRFKKLKKDCDHDAIFSLLYLRTTETYGATAETIGYSDVNSVTREDAQFADYYFRAYDAYHDDSGVVPPAWQIAFSAAAAKSLTAQGNALLGINAHIQRDLPFTLYDLYVQGHPVSYADHTLVNNFLAQVDVAPEIIATFDPTYPPGNDLSTIIAWRELAWQNFVALRDAPNAVARAAVAAAIENYAAGAAAFFAQLTAYPPGSNSDTRDAFCEAHN